MNCCAIKKTERRKPLMATSVREDVAGGCTVIAAACLTTTKRSASAARASPRLASAKRHQLRVLGQDHLNTRRKRRGEARRVLVLVRGRTTTRSLRLSSLSRRCEGEGYMVVCFSCGALPVVLVLFVCFCFFLATLKRVHQADMREFCHHVMRAGGSSTWLLVFLQCAPCRVYFIVLSFLPCNIEGRQRGLRFSFVHY